MDVQPFYYENKINNHYVMSHTNASILNLVEAVHTLIHYKLEYGTTQYTSNIQVRGLYYLNFTTRK